MIGEKFLEGMFENEKLAWCATVRYRRCELVGLLVSFRGLYKVCHSPHSPISADHGAVDLPVVIGGRVVTPGDLVVGG